ncbi:DNA-directed RNA polymerase II subunit RPB1-like isoform X2 [Sycon ciliatum]|uniref:DNA-directed RNA polymerase II subunit RPB1-like isoform X2 n=1 Tax=Sycon ciliatum TaxID=27933 RepID=UPI0031F6F913
MVAHTSASAPAPGMVPSASIHSYSPQIHSNTYATYYLFPVLSSSCGISCRCLACSSDYCNYKGNCTYNVLRLKQCSCSPGYTGALCATEIFTSCSSSYCHYNGDCTSDPFGQESCSCHAGFLGLWCEAVDTSNDISSAPDTKSSPRTAIIASISVAIGALLCVTVVLVCLILRSARKRRLNRNHQLLMASEEDQVGTCPAPPATIPAMTPATSGACQVAPAAPCTQADNADSPTSPVVSASIHTASGGNADASLNVHTILREDKCSEYAAGTVPQPTHNPHDTADAISQPIQNPHHAACATSQPTHNPHHAASAMSQPTYNPHHAASATSHPAHNTCCTAYTMLHPAHNPHHAAGMIPQPAYNPHHTAGAMYHPAHNPHDTMYTMPHPAAHDTHHTAGTTEQKGYLPDHVPTHTPGASIPGPASMAGFSADQAAAIAATAPPAYEDAVPMSQRVKH